TPPWEASGPRPARSISANIKSRRRVAALFKPEMPAPSEAPAASDPPAATQLAESPETSDQSS
ncbi:MAG: hypothetical protein KIT47_21060, partial [Rhodoferax sp.]|nr:hypothetical protein [Rhodoferax sp.]